MATSSLKLNLVTRRLLTKTEAADHCGLPAKVFDRLDTPAPLRMASGYDRFDIRDLDAWIDSLKGGRDMETDDAIVGRLE